MTGCEGQDWSSYQSAAPPAAGLAFAGVKATEGTGYVSPQHAAQVAHARAAGLVIIHYHFVRPGSMSAQAAYFLQHAAAQPGDALCLDWEDPGVSSADKDAWLKAAQAKAPGHRVLLYCNRDFWLNREKGGFVADGLWIADPSAAKGAPRITAPWVIQQYSSAGSLDRDYSHLDAAQLRAWLTQTTPTPEDDVALTAAQATALAQIPQIASDVATLKTNLMNIGSLDGDGTHAAGYFLAHSRHDALSAYNAVVSLAKSPAAPALTDAQVAALATQVAASPGLATAIATAVLDLEAKRLQS